MNSLYKTIDNILKENNINNKEMDEAILKNAQNYLYNIFDSIGVPMRKFREACRMKSNDPILINDVIKKMLEEKIKSHEGFPTKKEMGLAIEHSTELMREINTVIENILKENFKDDAAFDLRFKIKDKLSDIAKQKDRRIAQIEQVSVEIIDVVNRIGFIRIDRLNEMLNKSYYLFVSKSESYNDKEIGYLSEKAQAALNLIRLNHLLDICVAANNYNERFFSIDRTDNDK